MIALADDLALLAPGATPADLVLVANQLGAAGDVRSVGFAQHAGGVPVLGGAIGVLVYTELWVGFTAISSLLIPGLAQTVLSYRGHSLVPGFGGNRPVLAEPERRSAAAHR